MRSDRRDLVPPPITWPLWLSDGDRMPTGEAAPAIDQRRYDAGSLVFREGQAGDEAYVVHSGAIEIFKGAPGAAITLAVLGERALFGEMALLDAQPRSASAMAQRDTVLYVLRKRDFERPFKGINPWVEAVMLTLARNLRNANRAHLGAADPGDTASAV